MKSIKNALILWWALTWRWVFVAVCISAITLGVNYVFALDSEQYHGVGVAFIVLLIGIMFWMLGGLGQHAINHAFGKKNIVLLTNGRPNSSASWVDGLVLQWAILWRNALINLLIILLFILVFSEPLLLGIQHTVSNETNQIGVHGTGALNTELFLLTEGIVLRFLLGVISTWHLLKQPFGSRVYQINSK